MKADKAVCTNEILDDLTKAIKYDAIFTTLFENKFSAIKRDYEERKKAKKKKSKCFNRIIFGKRFFNNRDTVKKNFEEVTKIKDLSIKCKDSAFKFKRPTLSKKLKPNNNLISSSQIENTRKESNSSNGTISLSEKGTKNLVVEVITHQRNCSYNDSDEHEQSTDNQKTVLSNTKENMVVSILDLCNKHNNINSNTTIADNSITTFKSSSENNSISNSRFTIGAGVPATISYEKETQRSRILEARSISAQCSPILSRHKQIQYINKKNFQSLTNQCLDIDPVKNLKEQKFLKRQGTSEDSANLTASTFVNEADSISLSNERKSKSTSILVRPIQKNKNDLIKKDVYNDQSNPLLCGLMSSLNQLTATSSFFPEIAKSIITNPIPVSENVSSQLYFSNLYHVSTAIDPLNFQRMASTSTGSSVAQTGCCATISSMKEKDKYPRREGGRGQSNSDDEKHKKKRKFKRHHRCSNPSFMYPSSNDLQQRILSMPPNNPLEYHYADDFDLGIQIEPSPSEDLEDYVQSHRNTKHRHHRRKKRRKHHKSKIFVHDLDTQSVKILDPDDLSQRARWTIIATACMLLVMCLMLVGITLRMAPIIDDMGKYLCTF